jgi:serine protease Do
MDSKKLVFALVLGLASAVGVPQVGLVPQSALAQVRDLPDFPDLVEKVGSAVVNIRTAEKIKSSQSGRGKIPLPPGMDDETAQELFKKFFPPSAPRGREGDEVPRGTGSGFMISADGYLLTNHHVVFGADEITVTLSDKREYKAKLIGSDERTDVAVLKIETTGLPFLRAGDVNKLRVGEWVLAIGSPFGLDNTVTAGIVSAKNRDIGELLPFIQTDAAVNPGNSGGPLLNMKGEVVGINSQILSRSGGFQGISLAIPIDEAIRVADSLRTTGRVVRGLLGVSIQDVRKEVADALGMAKASGAAIMSVEAGSPAEKAGLLPGDIVTKFEGKVIEKSNDIRRFVGSTKPGTKVTLQALRNGVLKDFTATVSEVEPEKTAANAKPGNGRSEKPVPPPPTGITGSMLGLSVTDMSDERKKQLKLKAGVSLESIEPNGPAATAGLKVGDTILAINLIEITSAKQFSEVVGKLERNKVAALLVRRADATQYISIRPSPGK